VLITVDNVYQLLSTVINTYQHLSTLSTNSNFLACPAGVQIWIASARVVDKPLAIQKNISNHSRVTAFRQVAEDPRTARSNLLAVGSSFVMMANDEGRLLFLQSEARTLYELICLTVRQSEILLDHRRPKPKYAHVDYSYS
jgi:hypothetical protein